MRYILIAICASVLFCKAVLAEETPLKNGKPVTVKAKGNDDTCPHAVIVAAFLGIQDIIKKYGYEVRPIFKNQQTTDMTFQVKKDGQEVKRFDTIQELNDFMESLPKPPK